MNANGYPCVARLQIGNKLLEISAVAGTVDDIDEKLGMAIGEALAGMRNIQALDHTAILRHAATWATMPIAR